MEGNDGNGSATLNLSGGSITDGGVYVTGTNAKATVKGKPVVADLELATVKLLTLGKLNTGADITVTAEGVFTEANANAQSYVDAGYIKAPIVRSITVNQDNTLSMAVTATLSSIAVTTEPTKHFYQKNEEELDITGGKITLTYTNGGTEVIDMTADMVTGFSNATAGPVVLTVTYSGKTCTYTVEVVGSIYDAAKTMTFTSTEADGKVSARCPKCGVTHDWYPLPALSTTANGSIPVPAGHYYASADVTLTTVESYWKVTGNACIHLNGKNLDLMRRAFYVEASGAEVNFMGDGSVSGGNANYEIGTLEAITCVNLYGGIWENTGASPAIATRGTTAQVDIYEGTVIRRAAGLESGGCVYITDKTQVNMYGGTVIGGDSTGNDNVNGAAFWIKAHNANAWHCSLNIYGGSITGGTDEKGGNIYVQGTNGNGSATLNIYGGTVTDGGVYVTGTNAKAEIGGKPVIAELELAAGKKLTLGDMETGADVTVLADGVFTAANDNAQSYVDVGYIKAATGKQISVNNDNTLTMANAASLLMMIFRAMNLL